MSHSPDADSSGAPQNGLLAAWHRTPLYIRILGALILGVIVGRMMGPQAKPFEIPSKLILRMLGALAPPLILVAVIHALMTAEMKGRMAARLMGLLVLNTLVAIVIGLFVANTVRPGRLSNLKPTAAKSVGETAQGAEAQDVLDMLEAHGYKPAAERAPAAEIASRLKSVREVRGIKPEDAAAHLNVAPEKLAEIEAGTTSPTELQLVSLARLYKTPVAQLIAAPKDILAQFLDNIPDSLLKPLVDNTKVLGVIFIAVAFGIALRKERHTEIRTVEDLFQLAFRALLGVLHWIIDLVPLGVFGIVASIVGEKGFEPFIGLGAFILSVMLALALQASYYLLRVKFGSWVCPLTLLEGCRDALVMAFSTASSTATMPLTYECLRERVKLREESAGMGALVGANFNNDGTALYEAMSALFISQMLGIDLSLPQQFMVVITSILASVGAAGIPEAGLVTMTLVFTAVGLPPTYIALLLTVDWFLDRCRTAINVMGDMNVSCMLDGKTPETPETSTT